MTDSNGVWLGSVRRMARHDHCHRCGETLRTRSPRSTTSRCRWGAGEFFGILGPTAPARPLWSRSSRGCGRPTPARSRARSARLAAQPELLGGWAVRAAGLGLLRTADRPGAALHLRLALRHAAARVAEMLELVALTSRCGDVVHVLVRFRYCWSARPVRASRPPDPASVERPEGRELFPGGQRLEECRGLQFGHEPCRAARVSRPGSPSACTVPESAWRRPSMISSRVASRRRWNENAEELAHHRQRDAVDRGQRVVFSPHRWQRSCSAIDGTLSPARTPCSSSAHSASNRSAAW